MSNEDLNRLREAIRSARHFLPAQGPISIFVHHNTLHHFEDLPFREAVLVGGARYDCQPYLSERRYHAELEKGRISVSDLRQVLLEDLGEYADNLIASFGTSYTLRLAILQMHLHTAPDAELNWLLAETDLLRRFRSDVSPARRDRVVQQTQTWVLSNLTSEPHRDSSPEKLPTVVRKLIDEQGGRRIESWNDARWEEFCLQLLWRICSQGVHAAASVKCLSAEQHLINEKQDSQKRLRDLLLQATNEDIDQTVNEVLIRFCGSFLDQGFATLTLPEREKGFAHAFAKLYLQPLTVRPGWMHHLRPELQKVLAADFDPLQSINESLAALGVDKASEQEILSASLLSLRGWAGMLWQMESKPEFHPYPAPPGTLEEYLAIRLILERHAISYLGERVFDTRDISTIRTKTNANLPPTSTPSPQQQTYTVFQLAEANGWTPEELINMSQPQWACLLDEINAFDSLERRRILHQAYERHYSVATLDAISIHARRRETESASPSRPAYAAIFCIDDREESFRRHLEEVDPECVTVAAAGFYAVAMYYRGTDHANFRPLCPASITPTHFVQEESVFSAIDAGERRAMRRRRIGKFQHQMHSHSRTLVGGWVTGLFGAIATFPMVARILAPRLTARIRESMETFTRPPATELHLERVAAEPGPEGDALGYSLTEMAGIVRRILEDLGMVADFPPIIIFFGHGSGSLNNPHESAYSCGACSGGRGGPNARAFAVMANDPRVRRILSDQGLEIPEEIRFVGAFHNTCNDKVDYYDVDLLPRSHRSLFRRIEQSVNETRARNAHERARRFESASLNLSTTAALEHVEQRAEDLSQARPEYNHATNAVMIVGRRDWTRGLFMDRRAFLTSYDPALDSDDCPILTRILQAAIPVCAGISLEYYFSTVDTEGYGCGSKLPHNVTSMLGVMTGAASDLRPGLSQQMVEIHEPMRILCVIETTAEKMLKIIADNPPIGRLVRGEWVGLAIIDPSTGSIQRYVQGKFEPYLLESNDLPQLETSLDWYRGTRDHLGYASIHDTTPFFKPNTPPTRRPS